MEVRHATNPDELRHMSDEEIRARFVISDLFTPGQVAAVYSHEDRMVLGGAQPTPGTPLTLENYPELRAEFFCQRRELAVTALNGTGTVVVDGTSFQLSDKDALYIGRGAREISFEASIDGTRFFLSSAVSDRDYPTTLIPAAEALTTETGEQEHANRRIVRKHIHEDGVASSQLVLGITAPEPGNVWNSMPPHTHDRRTEVYVYFDIDEQERVFHFMGLPGHTRHVALKNGDVVISPAWSMHFGVGTTNYSFLWVMAGENQSFADMDHIAVPQI
ncbi:5-dehydro-4-deoxy-D-glucuronate isomerase [Leucobacter luti]|uniref:5-dehydro-4-deoxy-D-glucuronate isomerase n=1 Tax=Leucobacter luti TaxID=340320 RepID=A0A4Q7U250_9MICO|nr:5-dehydro-4-deoxy-D-glucuronate isomerase [Leucobacter luti]MBL3699377.1 5-dehydro-4-deoxy-D-glucuronate isomerase [Leucobacter luti]RZT66887.1 4-deoxy-L-threo-5-hexosulose-uronate ketol-isomerase [Leucobacter luti]